MHSSIPNPRVSPTISIPRAGSLFGLNKDQSYRAAKRGTIPTIQISPRRAVVPTAQMLRMLGLNDWETAPVAGTDNELAGAK